MCIFLVASAVVGWARPALAGNWPEWRGPGGNGLAEEPNLPVQWSDKQGILWKCAIPEWGTSTPIVWDDALFLTTQEKDKLLLLRVAADSGKIVWTRQVGTAVERRGKAQRREHTFHHLHNMASPSCVTDGKIVVAHFGNGDLAAYDFAGKPLWMRNMQKEHGNFTIWWGRANSPVLFHDLVIVVAMQDSLEDLQKEVAPSYLVAYDKNTGEQKWKTLRNTGARAEDCDSYTTPIFRRLGERSEMIVMGGNQIDAYDPTTGRQLWAWSNMKGSRTITGPVLGKDHVYATVGKRGPLFALKLDGKGKLSDDMVAWQVKQETPDSPSPVLVNGLLFTVTDSGFAACNDALTGALKWKERLGNDFKASLLAANGKVYCVDVTGKCTVFEAKAEFKKVAESVVDDEVSASPAAANGRLFLRGKKTLFCIGAK
jgi:outer membrane protein assembly factor BamB